MGAEKDCTHKSLLKLMYIDMAKAMDELKPTLKECGGHWINAFKMQSFRTKGARRQFQAAFALMIVIPILVIVYLMFSGAVVVRMESPFARSILLGLLPSIMVGIWLLIKYPLAVLRLRSNLQKIASGEMPAPINLSHEGDDLIAIERYLNLILLQTRERIALIQEQQLSILKSEREKVMMESLATVCHHISQPATTMICCIDILKKETIPEQLKPVMDSCCEASSKLRDLLRDLQLMDVYRATAYLGSSEEDAQKGLSQILDLKEKRINMSYGPALVKADLVMKSA